jgi:valyl-tRNA synthetase
VLDTWFSSWLWPLTIFDYFEQPDNPDFRYYYPTQVLVTAPEILFFWVARMIMAGYYFTGEKPFSVVYLHGIVRDKLRRKMSKSLGNSPDPLDLIARYGADAVRLGIIMSAPAGNDLLFDEALCEQGRNFCNKLWNSFRLLRLWREKAEEAPPSPFQEEVVRWFEARLTHLHHEVEAQIQRYRFYEAGHTLYRGVWEDFCSWYLEALKPTPPLSLLPKIEAQALHLLSLLHPFMPFITEELWHEVTGQPEQVSLGLQAFPPIAALSAEQIAHLEQVAYVQEAITRLRGFRHTFGMQGDFDLVIQTSRPSFLEAQIDWLKHFLPVRNIELRSESYALPALRVVFQQEVFYVSGPSDPAAWESLRQRLQKELAHAESFLEQIERKLNNPGFRAKADPEVIAREEKKRSDTEARRLLLLEQLQALEAL